MSAAKHHEPGPSGAESTRDTDNVDATENSKPVATHSQVNPPKRDQAAIPWQSKSEYCYQRLISFSREWACGDCYSKLSTSRPSTDDRDFDECDGLAAWMQISQTVECEACGHVLCPEREHCRIRKLPSGSGTTENMGAQFLNDLYTRELGGFFRWAWGQGVGGWGLVGQLEDTFNGGLVDGPAEEWRPQDWSGRWNFETDSLETDSLETDSPAAEERTKTWRKKKPWGVEWKETRNPLLTYVKPREGVDPVGDHLMTNLRSKVKKFVKALEVPGR